MPTNPYLKPSDFVEFCLFVHAKSATHMEFEQYFEYYEPILQIIWFNPDIDTHLALESQASSVAVFGGLRA